MTITPMLQFIQDRILEAVHWCFLEEAREKELWKFWCFVKYYWDSFRWDEVSNYQVIKKMDDDILFKNIWLSDDINNPSYRVTYHNFKETEIESYEIIWLPPTLSRVLTALWPEFYCWNWIWHAEKISNNYENRKYVCQRELINKDWTDATLFDQTPETQLAIGVLLWWKDEA